VTESVELARIRLPRGEWFYDRSRRLGPPGGFGEVFEGTDAQGQQVAIKRLKVTAGEAAHRELKIADELGGKSFRHVLDILDSGEDSEGGGYFVVMPRAERSLLDEVTRRGKFSLGEAADILRQIAEGLKEVDSIVHRDLKPGNVLLHGGQWKIADFGIARFVEDATSANTVRDFLSAPFAAPEQWLEERTTHATDIYALSCVAHVLVTGAAPFPGPTRADFRRQHTSDSPPLLTGVDPRARTIFAAGLRKPQAGRPSIERVITVLQDICSNPTASTPVINDLHAANAAEAELVSAEAARSERDRREAAERQAILDAGEAIFSDILKRFERVIRENASEAQVHESHRKLTVRMGQAGLEIESQGAVPPQYCPWKRGVGGGCDRLRSRQPANAGVETWRDLVVYALPSKRRVSLVRGRIPTTRAEQRSDGWTFSNSGFRGRHLQARQLGCRTRNAHHPRRFRSCAD